MQTYNFTAHYSQSLNVNSRFKHLGNTLIDLSSVFVSSMYIFVFSSVYRKVRSTVMPDHQILDLAVFCAGSSMLQCDFRIFYTHNFLSCILFEVG